MEYNTDSKYNITKLIENHQNNKELLSIFLKDVDFSEVSSKTVWLNTSFINKETDEEEHFSRSPSENKESLALNCVNNLPLNYYSDYITHQWITFDKGNSHNIVNRTLSSHKYQFVNKLLDVCQTHLESLEIGTKEYNDYSHGYARDLLAPILNMGNKLFYLNHSQYSKVEDYENYYNLFKKAIKSYDNYIQKEYYNMYHSQFLPKHKTISESNWFVLYNKLGYLSFGDRKVEDILDEVVKNSRAFNIYNDIFKQLEKTKNNSLKTSETLNKAIKYGNIKVISHLSKFLDFNQNQLNDIINEQFTEAVNSFVEAYNAKNGQLSYSSDYDNYAIEINKFARLFTAPELNLTIKDKNLVSSFLVIPQKKIDNVMDKYPDLENRTIVKDLNLLECEYSHRTFYKFIQENNIELKNKNSVGKPTNYDLLLMLKASQYLNKKYNAENLKLLTLSLSEESKRKAEKVVAQLYFDMVEVKNEKEKDSIIGMYLLDNKIASKEELKDKSKLKI